MGVKRAGADQLLARVQSNTFEGRGDLKHDRPAGFDFTALGFQ